MKVVILNAGIGKRLKPLTDDNPKCLIEISPNITMLDVQLKNLLNCGLDDIIILTGYLEKKIKDYVGKHYPNLQIQYVRNLQYEDTNYIYTLYLAKDLIDEELLLFHGDLIFSEKLLREIIESNYPNCVLVNNVVPPPKKDFKALISNDEVKKIGVNLIGENTYFLAPLYKLSLEFFQKWLNKIEQFVQANKVNYYAEDALNDILDVVKLKPLYFNEPICMEIDDTDDLNLIKTLLNE